MSIDAISTVRLLLREFRTADVPAMDALFSDRECQRFLCTPGARSPSGEEWVSKAIAQRHSPSRRYIDLAICLLSDPDKAVGSLSIHVQDAAAKEASIEYMLERAHWGAGLVSEAVTAILDFTAQRLRDRVTLLRAMVARAHIIRTMRAVAAHATCAAAMRATQVVPENVGSCRVLEKTGFTKVCSGLAPLDVRSPSA